jgi:hypothetical protein
MLRTTLLAACATVLAACAGAPKAADPSSGEPQRIALVLYRNPRVLELVSEAHTARLAQYSEVRESAGRKVQSNELMEALVEAFRERGFASLARNGPAPRTAGPDAYWALEVEDDAGVAHAILSKSLSQADVRTCLELKNAFLEVYNATYGLQAVEVKEGESPFKTPEPPRKARP